MSIGNSAHDSVFTAYAFLSGTTLTALFFLIQKDPTNAIVLTTLGVACLLFIIATVARLNIAIGRIAKNTPFADATGWTALTGLILLFVSLIIIILSVNVISGIIVGAVSLAFFIILDRLARKS